MTWDVPTDVALDIYFLRHDVSMQNMRLVDSRYIGDFFIPLYFDKTGLNAQLAGARIGAPFLTSALVFASPFVRTRLTFLWALVGAGLLPDVSMDDFASLPELALKANEANRLLLSKSREELARILPGNERDIKLPEHDALRTLSNHLGARVHQVARELGIRFYEDERLVEGDFGRDDINHQRLERRIALPQFYRWSEGGESGLDVIVRSDSFLQSMWRQVYRKKITKIVIVGHGLEIRCLISRFLHLKIEEFNSLLNPENGDVIHIAPRGTLASPQFRTDKHEVEGLRVDIQD